MKNVLCLTMINKYAKFHGTQEQQIENLKAKGWKVYKCKYAQAVAAVGEMAGKIVYKVWQGKAAKPCAYYTARNLGQVEKSVTFYFERQKEREESRANRRKTQTKVVAGDHFEVGDILSYSWGYDQTNVDFFQVVRVLNRQVELRKVYQNSSDRQGGPTGGYCQPRRFEFVEGSEPFKKSVQVFREGEPGYISFDHGVGRKWDGKALYTSSYH